MVRIMWNIIPEKNRRKEDNKMKKTIFGLIASALMLAACDSMDSNYIDYLHNIKVYSPAITNLQHIDTYRMVALKWDNPQNDIIEHIKITWDIGEKDTAVITPGIVDFYLMEDLEIRGYTISVYTIDKYGNLSVPSTVNAFPSGNNDVEDL